MTPGQQPCRTPDRDCEWNLERWQMFFAMAKDIKDIKDAQDKQADMLSRKVIVVISGLVSLAVAVGSGLVLSALRLKK